MARYKESDIRKVKSSLRLKKSIAYQAEWSGLSIDKYNKIRAYLKKKAV